MSAIFESATRPPADVFYQRGDPHDPRLGEVVRADEAFYADSQVVILGCPQDEGVRRNQGRVGASAAPDAIRTYFYRLIVPTNFPRVLDVGNTRIQSSLEATHDLHRQMVRQLIHDGKKVIVLGGGNDISYPDCAALATEIPDVLAFNVDAHFDVRADSPRNSGTPYRQLLEEKHLSPSQFYQIGSQRFGNSTVYQGYLKNLGVQVHWRDTIQDVRAVVEPILTMTRAEAIFWGLDMDSVRASDAPGVSAPNPSGFSAEDFCEIARLAGADSRSRIFEISEVNPSYDIDGRTCRLAAVAMFYFLTALHS